MAQVLLVGDSMVVSAVDMAVTLALLLATSAVGRTISPAIARLRL